MCSFFLFTNISSLLVGATFCRWVPSMHSSTLEIQKERTYCKKLSATANWVVVGMECDLWVDRLKKLTTFSCSFITTTDYNDFEDISRYRD